MTSTPLFWVVIDDGFYAGVHKSVVVTMGTVEAVLTMGVTTETDCDFLGWFKPEGLDAHTNHPFSN
jgi:hypothetical protein